MLKEALERILKPSSFNHEPVSFEKMYSAVYKCVCKGFTGRLFENLIEQIGIIILKWTKDVQSVEGEAFVNAFNNILSHYIISLHSVVPIFYYMDRYSREIDLMRELLGSFVDKFANPNIIKLFVALNQMDPSSTSNKIIIQNLFEKLDNLPINYSTSTFQFYKKLKDTKIHCCNMELTQCFPQKRSHNAIDEDEPVSTIARY
nr:CDK2-associated and cullin domain-containing protein 1-like isoform X2 [Lepeophtheirus salmonis]